MLWKNATAARISRKKATINSKRIGENKMETEYLNKQVNEVIYQKNKKWHVVTTLSGASYCWHMIHGTPIFCDSAMLAAYMA